MLFKKGKEMTIAEIKRIGELIEKLKIDIRSCHKPYCEDGFRINFDKVMFEFNKDILDVISGEYKKTLDK